jgi:hypothetical protein
MAWQFVIMFDFKPVCVGLVGKACNVGNAEGHMGFIIGAKILLDA